MFKRPDLIHEINHLLAVYHQSLQSVGTPYDNQLSREELSCSRAQCLKTCDTAKNCILPQLKNETQNPHHGSEFTKQANQFIGCVNMFVNDMKRCKNLLRLFPAPTTDCVSIPGDSGASSSPTQSGNRDSNEKEMENLERDLKEAENILEALENAVTVHFSTKDHTGNAEEVSPTQQSSRRKGCQCGKICSYFKTSYA
uniref:Uncharacterized protein n=1 Tax=Romanomermis culicivorax TaxID=13658 RepID=A0A915J497_ROMCU